MTTYTFSVECWDTFPGQGVYVVGSAPELGSWNVPLGAATRVPEHFTTWAVWLTNPPIIVVNTRFIVIYSDLKCSKPCWLMINSWIILANILWIVISQYRGIPTKTNQYNSEWEKDFEHCSHEQWTGCRTWMWWTCHFLGGLRCTTTAQTFPLWTGEVVIHATEEIASQQFHWKKYLTPAVCSMQQFESAV